MASKNLVILLGRLGADPELRHTQGGKAVTELRVATSDRDKDGNEKTEWHSVIAWEKTAENCVKYLAKGREVYVEGRLATRSWEDPKTKEKKFKTEIVASNVQFIGGPSKAPVQERAKAAAGDTTEMEVPF